MRGSIIHAAIAERGIFGFVPMRVSVPTWVLLLLMPLVSACSSDNPTEPDSSPQAILIQLEILEATHSDDSCALVLRSSAEGGPGVASSSHARLFADAMSLGLTAEQVGWTEIRPGDVYGDGVSFGPASEGILVSIDLVYMDSATGLGRQVSAAGDC